MIKRILALVIFSFPTATMAERVSMKCELDDGIHIGELTIDLESKEMRFSHGEYDITHVNEQYITGKLRKSEVGGEIMVIHRESLKFERRGLSIIYLDANAPSKGFLMGSTASGHCSMRQV